MASPCNGEQRHGWPKSAPPKGNMQASPKNSNPNTTTHATRREKYSLPPDHFAQGSVPGKTRSGRHSIAGQIPSRPPNVTVVRNARASLPLIVPSSQKQGNRRAVVIAATYKGTQGVPQKCEDISHTTSLFRLLTTTLNFKKENVWILTDAPEKATGYPVKLGATRRNILTSLKWLIGGSRDGDILFFGFSGLGATLMTQDKQSENVSEDCLLPTDYPTSQPIAQTHLASLIAQSLHANASLTALIDTRDCSKVLKLPFVKNVFVSRARFVISEPSEHDATVGDEKPREVLFMLKRNWVKHEYNRMRKMVEKEERDILVSRFSRTGKVFAFGFGGASESDSKPRNWKPATTGALSHAFADCMLRCSKPRKDITYAYVLQSICASVATGRNSQLPQLASSHGLDICTTMALVEDTSST